MYLVPSARKLLSRIKKVQMSLSCFVVIGTDNNMYHATGYSFTDINNAVSSPAKNKLPKTYQDDLDYLIENGLVQQIGGAYQVTYDGWHNRTFF